MSFKEEVVRLLVDAGDARGRLSTREALAYNAGYQDAIAEVLEIFEEEDE